MGKLDIVSYIIRSAYRSAVKLETFCHWSFAISFSKSRYGFPNLCQFRDFRIFFKV